MPDALHTALARGLLTCLAFIELSDDHAIDPDEKVKVTELVGACLNELSDSDHAVLLALLEAQASVEPAGLVRDYYLSLPFGFGSAADKRP